MRIAYLGNFDNPYSDTTENHIKQAFEELGHQVITFEEKDFYNIRDRILEEIRFNNTDMFFFHKAGLDIYDIPPEEVVELLTYITCKKVFWFFDKIEVNNPQHKRVKWMNMILPFVDYGFLTDETWIRRHKFNNLYTLRQGVGGEPSLGKFRQEFDIPIAFLGAVYGERTHLISLLKGEFDKDFRVLNNIFGNNLKDLCASAKIFVAPQYPQDDFYWSSRIYQMIGNGGFLVHPKLEGLKEEGWIEGEHYVGYKNIQELIDKIRYYLEHEDERKKIQRSGYEFCIKNFTYKDRIKNLLKKINENSNI